MIPFGAHDYDTSRGLWRSLHCVRKCTRLPSESRDGPVRFAKWDPPNQKKIVMKRMFTLAGAALLALAVGCDDSILTPSETPSASKTAATSADSDWDKMAADLKKASAELEAEMAKLGAAMKEAPDWEQMEAEMKEAAAELDKALQDNPEWKKLEAEMKKASAELGAEMAKLGAAMKEAPDWEQMEAEMKKAAEEMERSMKEFENLGNSSDFGF